MSHGTSYSPANPNITYSVEGIRVSANDFMNFAGMALQDPLRVMESFARKGGKKIGFRNTGVSWGKPFDVVYDANNKIVSVTWGKFDPELQHVNYGTTSSIYSNEGIPDLNLLPQNPTTALNGEDIVNRATKILEKDKCAKFIKKLIATANRLSNRSDTPDLLDILEAVKTQGGFVYGNTILDYYGKPGATIHGSLAKKSAQIEYPFPPPFNLARPIKIQPDSCRHC